MENSSVPGRKLARHGPISTSQTTGPTGSAGSTTTIGPAAPSGSTIGPTPSGSTIPARFAVPDRALFADVGPNTVGTVPNGLSPRTFEYLSTFPVADPNSAELLDGMAAKVYEPMLSAPHFDPPPSTTPIRSIELTRPISDADLALMTTTGLDPNVASLAGIADGSSTVSTSTPMTGAGGSAEQQSLSPTAVQHPRASQQSSTAVVRRDGPNQLATTMATMATMTTAGSNERNSGWHPFGSAVGGDAGQTDGTFQVVGAPAVKDDERRLVERARDARLDAKGRNKEIPPFVKKLEAYLSDNANHSLIRWSEDGKSFIILDDEAFAKTLIPQRFKHNNYASFVRQLNMYGFHKRIGLEDGSLMSNELGAKTPHTYDHPYFQRDRPELQWLITKPKAGPAGQTGPTSGKRKRAQSDDDAAGSDDDEESRAEGDTVTIPRAEWNMMKKQLTEYRSTAQQMQVNTQHFIKALQELKSDAEVEKSITRQRIHALEGLSRQQAGTLSTILSFISKLYANHTARTGGTGSLPGYPQMLSPRPAGSPSGSSSGFGSGRIQTVGRSSSRTSHGRTIRRPIALLPAPDTVETTVERLSTTPPPFTVVDAAKSVSPMRTDDHAGSSSIVKIEGMHEPEAGPLDGLATMTPDQQFIQLSDQLARQDQRMRGLVDRIEPLIPGGSISSLGLGLTDQEVGTAAGSGPLLGPVNSTSPSFDWSQFLVDSAGVEPDLFSAVDPAGSGLTAPSIVYGGLPPAVTGPNGLTVTMAMMADGPTMADMDMDFTLPSSFGQSDGLADGLADGLFAATTGGSGPDGAIDGGDAIELFGTLPPADVELDDRGRVIGSVPSSVEDEDELDRRK